MALLAIAHSPAAGDTRPAILGGTPICRGEEFSWPPRNTAIDAALQRCIDLRLWGAYQGEFQQQLVAALRPFLQTEHVLLCSSGTSAVELGLRGLNIQPGDEVILAGYDFKGNFLNVIAVGAIPVLVDVDEITGQLDVNAVAAAITPQTRAIIATHLHGGIVNMPALLEIASRHELQVLEDACQMPGAWINGKRAGTWGDVGVISFGGTKLLSAGRGGALFTARDNVAARVRRWKIRGSDLSPLSELQAAVLLPQLETLDNLRTQRNSAVTQLCSQFVETDAIRPLPFGNSDPQSEADFYKVAFRYFPERCGHLKREVFTAALRAEGIPISPGFRGLHCIHAKSRFRPSGSLACSTAIDQFGLVLHHPILLGGNAAMELVLKAVRKVQATAEELSHAVIPPVEFPGPWEQDSA